MLFVGVEGAGETDIAIAEDVARAAEAFDGPLALAHVRGEASADGPLRIVVPFNGSGVARRAAEMAFALARASGGQVTVLYVSPSGRRGGRVTGSLTGLLRSEESILRDIAMLGDRSGATVKTAVLAGIPPERAILRFTRTPRHDLIVMGVDRHPGESLSFGPVADSVLARTTRPVLFVAS
jgi:nucleotide-binding universal stress UspA family protein